MMNVLTHATLLIGENSEALDLRAKELAQLAVCSAPVDIGSGLVPCGECDNCRLALKGEHFDIKYIRRDEDKQTLTVDIIRKLAPDAPEMPVKASRKVYIIPEADKMNNNAANAFLKLLEEPPSMVVFILTGERLKEFLPTIRSRCMLERVGFERDDSVAIESNAHADAIFEAFNSRNSAKLAAECIKLEKGLTRIDLLNTFSSLYALFAKSALSPTARNPEDYLEAVNAVSPLAEKMRAGVNVGIGHAAGTLMVKLNNILIR
jgi:hypothetical protein